MNHNTFINLELPAVKALLRHTTEALPGQENYLKFEPSICGSFNESKFLYCYYESQYAILLGSINAYTVISRYNVATLNLSKLTHDYLYHYQKIKDSNQKTSKSLTSELLNTTDVFFIVVDINPERNEAIALLDLVNKINSKQRIIFISSTLLPNTFFTSLANANSYGLRLIHTLIKNNIKKTEIIGKELNDL